MKRWMALLLAALTLLGALTVPVLAETRLTPADDSFSFILKAEEVNREWQRLKDALMKMEGYPQSKGLEKETLLDEDVLMDGAALAWKTNLISLSPDGERALIGFEDFPASVDLKDGSFRFLAPKTPLSGTPLQSYLDMGRMMLRESFLDWSEDGGRAIVSSPTSVFVYGKYSVNVILLDLKEGVYSLLDEQFAALGDVRTFDLKKIEGGVPYYAVFGPGDESVYAFYYAMTKDYASKIQIFEQNLAAGEKKEIASFPGEWADVSRIFTDNAGFMTSFRDYRARDKKGLLLFSWDGERREVLMKAGEDYSLKMEAFGVKDYRAGQIVLNLSIGSVAKPSNIFTWPRSVDNLDETVFDQALVLDGDGQVVAADPCALLFDAAHEARGAEIWRDGQLLYRLPTDAVLSPDGRRLLLAFSKDEEEETRFYLLDLESGASSEVTMEGGLPYRVRPDDIVGTKRLSWLTEDLITLLPRVKREPVFFTLK
ncbi:MAG: hypothetical protein QM308_06405 [Bacillota bacterium]|nr:hypothetical protein [Bacillota bacterium]